MILDKIPFAYRDYGNFIIFFSNLNYSHFIVQDIYVDFFKLYFENKLCKEQIIEVVSLQYDVPSSIVSNDLDSFFKEMSLISDNNNTNNIDVTEDKTLSDHDIYTMMSELLIPFSATIEITDSCNLKCIHCYRNIPNPSYWNLDTFEKALVSLKELGTLHLTLTGGEPLLHPHFQEFLLLAKKYGFVLTIQTNGTLNIIPILKLLSETSLKSIAISLYSTIPKTHDSITGKFGSCISTINTITSLVQNRIPVTINCPVMQNNKDDMHLVKKFADELGVSCNFSFKIIPSQNLDKNTKSLNCFSSQFLYECMINPQIELYKNILPNIRKASIPKRYCQTGFRSITFDSQGNVLLCNAYRKICGSIQNTDIKQIWTSSKELTEWREVTSIINDKCRNCKAFAYCEPCPAHEYTLTGNENSIDSLTCYFGNEFCKADEQICSKCWEVTK